MLLSLNTTASTALKPCANADADTTASGLNLHVQCRGGKNNKLEGVEHVNVYAKLI